MNPPSSVKKRKPLVGIMACDSCRSSKVKCDGKNPCSRCARRGTFCHFSPGRKRGPQPHSAKENPPAAPSTTTTTSSSPNSGSSSPTDPFYLPESLRIPPSFPSSESDPEPAQTLRYPPLHSFVVTSESSPEEDEEEEVDGDDEMDQGYEETPQQDVGEAKIRELAEDEETEAYYQKSVAPASCQLQQLHQQLQQQNQQPPVEDPNVPQLEVSLLTKEVLMGQDLSAAAYVDQHISVMSQFWNEPASFFRKLLRTDRVQGQIQMYSLLSMMFVSQRNGVLANTLVNKAMTLAKDVFDDYRTNTSLNSGLAMSLLSVALMPTDITKSKFYSKLAVNLLEDVDPGAESKLALMKQLSINANQNRFARKVVPADVILKDLQTIKIQGQLTLDPLPAYTHSGSSSVEGQSIKTNPIFQVIRKHFTSTLATAKARQDPQLAARLFLIESYFTARSLLGSFLPQLVDSPEHFTLRMAEVAEGSIPVEVAYPILDFLALVEKISEKVHVIPIKRLTGYDDLKSIIYRSLGEVNLALEAARRSVNMVFRWLQEDGYVQLIRCVLPLFFSGACLCQYGQFEEVDAIIELLVPFSEIMIYAREIVEIFTTLKTRAFLPQVRHPSSPAPQFQPFVFSPSPQSPSQAHPSPPSTAPATATSPSGSRNPPPPFNLSLPGGVNLFANRPPLSSPQIWLNDLNADEELSRLWPFPNLPFPNNPGDLLVPPTTDLEFLEELAEEGFYPISFS